MPPSEPPRSSRSKKRRPARNAPSSTARQNAAFGSKPARPLPKPRPAPRPARVVQAKPLQAQPPRNIRAGKPVRTKAQKQAVHKAVRQQAAGAAQDAAKARARAVTAAGKTGGDFSPSQRQPYHPTPLPKPLSPTVPKHISLATLNPQQKSPSDRAAERTAKRIGHEINLHDDGHYYAKVKRTALPDVHIPVDPFTGKEDKSYSKTAASTRVQQQSVQAPALKILDQTTRLGHAMAAQEVGSIKRHGVVKGLLTGVAAPGSKEAKARRRDFRRGLALKDRSLGSDVLKAAGVKNKAIAGVGGFALDVGQSPLTYATGGTGSVAERAALQATRKVARKTTVRAAADAAATTAAKTQGKVVADATKQALRAGAKPRRAAKIGKRAGQRHVQDARDTVVNRFTAGPARRAREAAPAGRGVTVNVAGVEVPGVRRATAKVARGTRKGARKVVGKTVSEAVPAVARAAVREVAPRVNPGGITTETHMAARAQTRAARATTQAGAETADKFERALKEQVPDQADRNLIVAALERNNISHVMGPAYRKALKQTKGDRRKALDLAEKADPKAFAHGQKLAGIARNLRDEFKGVHTRAGRAGAHQKSRPGDFLTGHDVRDLQRTVAAEQTHRADVIRKLADRETQAREQALLTEQAGTLRHGARTAVQRVQEIARARTAVVRATKALRNETAKPVTQRRGVPALEARAQQARAAWEHARRPTTARVNEAPRTVGPREGQAAERFSNRAADSALAEQRLVAAHNVPAQKVGESHAAYLRRVHQYAKSHGLSRVQNKAARLLKKKPAQQAKGYFPHETASRAQGGSRGFVERATGVQTASRQGSGRVVKKITSGQRRVHNEPIEAANPQRVAKGLEPFTRDPVVVGNHFREAAHATSQGEFAQHMAQSVGRPVRSHADLHEGEDLYKLGFDGGQYKLTRVTSQKAPARTADLQKYEQALKDAKAKGIPASEVKVPARLRKTQAGPNEAGQFVAMPKGLFEQMEKSTKGTATDNPLLMVLDRAQGGWKKASITSLAFQIRNMIGDVQAGYYVPGAFGSLGKIPQASRAVARHSEATRQLRAPATHATIHVAGRHEPLDQFLKGAIDNGVLDSGVIARDVMQDTASGLQRVRAKGARTAPGRAARRGGRAVNRWITNRENVMRLATYKAGLDRGMTKAEAADMANLFHIDYSELSASERAFFRRAMPFYTWTARSLPVAGLTMLQRPGKFANLEFAREETGAAFTGQSEQDQRAGMPPSVKRQVPFPIRVAGSNYAVSASLPLTLLNEFPGGTSKKDLGNWLDELSHFGAGMVGPYAGIKPAAERLVFNRSAYTRQDIKDTHHPLVPAPGWISKAPDWVKHMTGATMIVDPNDKTGPKVWGWRGTTDWTSRQVSLGVLQQASTAAAGARPGQEKLPPSVAIGSPLIGVRADKLGRQTVTHAQTQKLRDELFKLTERQTILNQQGIHSDNATPEYKALRKRINEINKVVYPRKKKARKSGGGGGGFSGFGGGGGGQSSGGFSGF